MSDWRSLRKVPVAIVEKWWSKGKLGEERGEGQQGGRREIVVEVIREDDYDSQLAIGY